LRPTEVRLALVGLRRIAGARVPLGRDLEGPIRAAANGHLTVPNAGAGHGILGARPLARDPAPEWSTPGPDAGAGRRDRSHRTTLLRRVRRRVDRPAPARRDLDPSSILRLDASRSRPRDSSRTNQESSAPGPRPNSVMVNAPGAKSIAPLDVAQVL